MALVLIRTVILTLLTLLALRLMGKRQIGQLQPFEFVIILIISELAAIAMNSNSTPIMNSIVPMMMIVFMQIAISLLSLKSQTIREIVCGKPVLILSGGRLQRDQMRKLRLNLNDLLELCRGQGYFDIFELDTIVMETNGQISIFRQTGKRPVEVDDLGLELPQEQIAEFFVLDGKVNQRTLFKNGKDLNWLNKQLKRHKIDDVCELFIAGTDSLGEFFYQTKQQCSKGME
jgi:uncharacterized membrane protein YcaP (DUF421 family)